MAHKTFKCSGMLKLSQWMILLLTFVSTAAIGQTLVTIGDPSSSSYTGKYPFYGAWDYGWCNALYLSSEIGTAGTITQLEFDVVNTPDANYTMNNQKIYVRHTTTGGYPDQYYPGTSGFTLVFDGTITYDGSSGWKSVTLDTPFEYNGTDHLEFLFENRDGSYVNVGFPEFRYTSGQSTYTVRRDYEDGTFPGSCVRCGRFTNQLNIRMTLQTGCDADAGTATANGLADCEDSPFDLNLSGFTGTFQRWESSTDGVNYSTAGTTNPLTVNATENTYYRAVVSGTGGCEEISNTVFAKRGTRYYVNDNSATDDEYTTAPGNDANDGISPATPKATVSAVLDAYTLTECDIIYIDAGNYTEAVIITSADQGSSTGNITIQGAGKTKTTMTAPAGADNFHLENTSHIGIRDMKLVVNDNTARNIDIRYSSNNLIAGCDMSQTTDENILIEGNATAAGNNIIENNTLFNDDDGGKAIIILGNSDNNIIRNNTLTTTGLVSGYSIVLSTLSDGGTFHPRATQILSNNIAADDYGIVLLGTHHEIDATIIKDNTITIASSDKSSGSAIYCKAVGSTTSEVSYITENRLIGGKNGIYFSSGVDFVKIINNYISGSEMGINVSYYNSDVNYAFFNSFNNTVRNIYFVSDAFDGWKVLNNIFSVTGTSGENLYLESTADLVPEINYNIYHSPNGANTAVWGTTTYPGLASWQAADHSDNGNGDENSLEGDPEYDNFTEHNLDIFNTSVAFKAGVTVSGVETDIYGITRPVPPSIGAAEGNDISITISIDDADTLVCPGEPLTFTVTPPGIGLYQFFVNGEATKSGASNVFAYNQFADGDQVYAKVTRPEDVDTVITPIVDTILNPSAPGCQTDTVAGCVVLTDKSSQSGTATTFTWDHTVSQSDNRLLIITLAYNSYQASLTGLSYGGSGLSYVTSNTVNGLTSRIYKMTAPPVGTAQVQVTFSGTQDLVAGAYTLQNVDQADPTLGAGGGGGTFSSISKSIVSANGGMVIDVGISNGIPSAGSGQTVHYNFSADNIYSGSSSKPGQDSSVTMSWTFSGASVSTLSLVSIRPVAGCSGTEPVITYSAECYEYDTLGYDTTYFTSGHFGMTDTVVVRIDTSDTCAPAFAVLEKELTGAYVSTTSQGKLNFFYEERYNVGASATLDYTIYDKNRQALTTGITVPNQYGSNWRTIDLTGAGLVKDVFYVLEIKNDKGEVLKLRFKYDGGSL